MDSYQYLGHGNGSNTTYNYNCYNNFTEDSIFCEWLDGTGEGKQTIIHKCTVQNTTETQTESASVASTSAATTTPPGPTSTYNCTKDLTTIFMENVVRPFNEFNVVVEYPTIMTNQSSTEKKSLLCSSSSLPSSSGNHSECVLKLNAIDYLLSSYGGLDDADSVLLPSLLYNSSTTEFTFINSSSNASDLLTDFGGGDDVIWTYVQLALVTAFILIGGIGNILVCLAIGLDKKLHNVTNMFLFSLAIADLLVSLFVMPMGAIPAFWGEFFEFAL